MSVSKFALSAMTALSLVAVPVVASANPASSLSVASRVGAPSQDVSDARGNGGKRRGAGLIIAILAAAAIIAGIIIAADNNNNPTSR